MKPIGRVEIAYSVAAFAAGLAAFALFYSAFGANNLYEFCHYADIARTWTAGDGFATRIAEPGMLAVYDAHGVPPVYPYPVLYRFPLYASLVALVVRVFGFSDVAICLVNGLIHAAIAAAIVLIGARLAGRRAGLIAGVAFALHPVFAGRYAISGFAGPSLALCLLVLHYLLAEDGAWSARRATLAGAVLGLAYMARYNLVLFAPVYLVLAWRKTGWAGRVLFALAGLAAVSPIFAYNLRHFGALNPYPTMTMNLAAYATTGDVDPWRLYRTFSLGPLLAEHWREIAAKGVFNFFVEFVPGIVLTWKMAPAFLLIALGVRRRDSALRESAPLRRFVLLGGGLLLFQGIAFSPLRLELLSMPNVYYQGRYFAWFAPTLLIAAGAVWARYAGGRRYAGWIAAGGAAVLLAWPWAGANWSRYHFDPDRDPAAPVFRSLNPDDAVLLSNMAFQASAYYGVNSLDLPPDFGEVEKMLVRHPMTHAYIDLRYHRSPAFSALFGADPAARDALVARTGFRLVEPVRTGDGRIVGLLLSRATD